MRATHKVTAVFFVAADDDNDAELIVSGMLENFIKSVHVTDVGNYDFVADPDPHPEDITEAELQLARLNRLWEIS